MVPVPKKKETVRRRGRATKKSTSKSSSQGATARTRKAKKGTVTVTKQTIRSVAIPSPFRFPAIRNVSLSTVTRFAGIFFVVAGGFFSLLNFQYIEDAYVHDGRVHLAATLEYSSREGSDTISTAENADIRLLIREASPIEGKALFEVFASEGSGVTLYAKNASTGVQYFLGSLMSKLNGIWSLTWDSTRIPDGSYVFIAQSRQAHMVVESAPVSKDIQNNASTSISLAYAAAEGPTPSMPEQNSTEENERLIRERIGDEVQKDADSDGISDYDESNLYHTDLFAADTDGDGYMDGTEISLGRDPHSEAYIAYESAKEKGVVREDILWIESVTTVASATSDAVESPQKKALISGRGLPNSYVTLYIYSTPIIVTAKTDEDGEWNYVLDRELEDGEHEVYVGVTDQTGMIIAKSNPFRFVKTADAFEEPVTAIPAVFENQTSSLVDIKMMTLVASMAVVALGLVLILLGIHVSRKDTSREAEPGV